VLIGYEANIDQDVGKTPRILESFFKSTSGVSTGFHLTLARSINQDGLGRSNPRRVYSNLRHTLGPLVPQKRLGL
jgi:hypothetical protein